MIAVDPFSWDAFPFWCYGVLGLVVLAGVIWVIAVRADEVDEFEHPIQDQAAAGEPSAPAAGRLDDIDAEWAEFDRRPHPYEDDASRRTTLEAGDE